ncbi:MAG: GNAT family N-acetyltransferase [Usitatibacter sp.]
MELVRPALAHLESYRVALERGFSPDNIRREIATREELAAIAKDPRAFLDRMDDREAKGPPISLPDGSTVPRLPGLRRWMWDGEFCGSINFRWQPGTSALPAHVLGHIGYAVVPWKRRLGYATRALALMLDIARAEGLAYVEITSDEDNVASQKVIAANGGALVERFVKPAAYGGKPSLRYRLDTGVGN